MFLVQTLEEQISLKELVPKQGSQITPREKKAIKQLFFLHSEYADVCMDMV